MVLDLSPYVCKPIAARSRARHARRSARGHSRHDRADRTLGVGLVDQVLRTEAVESGFANRAFPVDDLDAEVLKVAEQLAKVPPDLQQMNKRAVHRQMELMGIRAAIRSGTEIQALAFHTDSTRAHFKELAAGLTDALSKRDGKFGDYRTKDN